jgi:hypothetical protein
MLRKREKTKVFLHIEPVYVKEARKKDGLSSPRARLCYLIEKKHPKTLAIRSMICPKKKAPI